MDLLPSPYLSPSELCSQYTDIYDGIGMLALNGVVVFEMVGVLHNHLCIHILMNCVHKYTNIYHGIGLLALNWELVLGGVYYISLSLSISF